MLNFPFRQTFYFTLKCNIAVQNIVKKAKANDCNISEEPVMAFTPKLHKNLMKIKVGNQTVDCLLDTGAAICAISHHLLKQVAPNAQIRPSYLTAIVGVCGERHSVLGMVEFELQLRRSIIYTFFPCI